MFKLFKKKTREQLVIEKSEKVFFSLIYDSECTFTNIEKVQILNNVRRRLSDNLNCQKKDLMEESVCNNQKTDEIDSALSKIE